MKLSYYRKILQKLREIHKRDCFDELSSLFTDVSREALESIIFQECQRKTKKTYHYHAAAHNIAKYYGRYLEGKKAKKEPGYLLKIADEVDLSPALMAKFILEHHFKEPEVVKLQPTQKYKTSEMLKNSALIDDADLAAEIRLCVLADESYGPISDVIRNSIGQEYECKLKNKLTELGFSFIDEKQLREKGYDKTPDVKLDIPIAVDGHVVNWIESKASFGDEDRHREYLRDQYWSYCNRFGPGLVIYWAGYIEELNVHKEHGILICDTVPTQFTVMDPSLLMKKAICINIFILWCKIKNLFFHPFLSVSSHTFVYVCGVVERAKIQ